MKRPMTVLVSVAVAVVGGVLVVAVWPTASEAIVQDERSRDMSGPESTIQENSALAHKLVIVAEDVVLNNGETFVSDYLDTRGCFSGPKLMERLTPGTGGVVGDLELRYSWDRVVDDVIVGPFEVSFSGDPGLELSLDPKPYTKISQTNDTGVQQTLTMILYCVGSAASAATVGGFAEPPDVVALGADDRGHSNLALFAGLAVVGLIALGGTGWYVLRRRAG